MNARLLGLFSGFPTHHFTDAITDVLREDLPRRESLIFISAWPDDCSRNDADSDGMHEMFAERGMGFVRHSVIDRRTGSADAARQIREADCVFLMGGDPPSQMALIRELGLVPALLACRAVILGISAGSMNMGRYAADCWETKELYEGIGLVDIVTKGHYENDAWFVPVIKEISMTRPVIAMEDESAIFIRETAVWQLGNNHLVDRGVIARLTDDKLRDIAQLDDLRSRNTTA
ncbi:MAG: Type 1 glutamine amidotransferase-like domain-containing protein [Clostridia bacterium]|nr:Type 1 glutamine amidotransferase-like domain-containing protein [Clostridia bacterium]